MVPFPAVDIDDDEDEDDKNWGGDGSTITSVIDFTPRRVELKSGRVVRLGNLYDNEEGPLEIKGTVVDVHRDGTTLATDNIVTLSWFFGGPRSGEHSSSTSKSERAKIGVRKLLPQRVAGNIATDDAYHYYRVVSGRIRRSVACDGKSWDVTFPAPDFVLNFEGGGREFLLTMSGRVGDFVGDVCSELLSKDSTFAGLMPVYEGSGGVKQGVAVRLSLVEMFKILSPITDSCSVVRYFDDLFDSCANRLFEQAGTQATAQNLLEAVVNSSTHSRNELLGFSIYRIHNPRAPTGLTEITLDYDASKKLRTTPPFNRLDEAVRLLVELEKLNSRMYAAEVNYDFERRSGRKMLSLSALGSRGVASRSMLEAAAARVVSDNDGVKVVYVIMNCEGSSEFEACEARLSAHSEILQFVVGNYETFFDNDDDLRKDFPPPHLFLVYDKELSTFKATATASKPKPATILVTQRLADQQRLNLGKFGSGEIWLSFGSIRDRNDSRCNKVYDQRVVFPREIKKGFNYSVKSVQQTLADVKTVLNAGGNQKILWLLTTNKDLSRNDAVKSGEIGGGVGVPNPITLSLLRYRSLTLSIGDGNVALVHEKLSADTIKRRLLMFGANVDVLVATIDTNTGMSNVNQLDAKADLVIIENTENFFLEDSGGLASLQLVVNNCAARDAVLIVNEESALPLLQPLVSSSVLGPFDLEALAKLDDERTGRATDLDSAIFEGSDKIVDDREERRIRAAFFADEDDNEDGGNWLTMNRTVEAEANEIWINYFPALPYLDRATKMKPKARRKVTVIMVDGSDDEEDDEDACSMEDEDDEKDGIEVKLPKKARRSRLISDEEASKLSGRVLRDPRLKNKSFGENDGIVGKFPLAINLERPDLVSKNNKEVMFLLLDCETTGFSAVSSEEPDRIVQLAAKVFRFDEDEDIEDADGFSSFSSYISNGDNKSGGGTEAITGISTKFLERGGIDPSTGARHEGGAPEFGVVFDTFLDWLKEARIDRAYKDDMKQWQLPKVVLLAHNARFDLAFLNAEVKRLRGNDATFAAECDLTSYIDTLKLLREKSIWSRPRGGGKGIRNYDNEFIESSRSMPPPPPPSYSQTAVYNHLFQGEGMQGSHNAMGDVVGLERVLRELDKFSTDKVGLRVCAQRLQVVFPKGERRKWIEKSSI